jgi:hypothetical protein
VIPEAVQLRPWLDTTQRDVDVPPAFCEHTPLSMPPKRTPSIPDRDGLPTTDHMDRLVAAYERIADEIRGIREAFDRLADDFSWALNNDKFKPEWFPRFGALAGGGLDADESASEPPVPPIPACNSMSAPLSRVTAPPPGAPQRDLFGQ